MEADAMVLEIRSFVTRELLEEVVPRLEAAGFVARPELDWRDPRSDGEFGAIYFTWAGDEPLPVDRFYALIRELEAVLEEGGPPGRFSLVDPGHLRP